MRRPAGVANRRSLVGRLAVPATSSTGGQSDVLQASAGGQRHRLANSYVDNSAPAAGELQLDMQGHKVGGCADYPQHRRRYQQAALLHVYSSAFSGAYSPATARYCIAVCDRGLLGLVNGQGLGRSGYVWRAQVSGSLQPQPSLPRGFTGAHCQVHLKTNASAALAAAYSDSPLKRHRPPPLNQRAIFEVPMLPTAGLVVFTLLAGRGTRCGHGTCYGRPSQ